MLIFNIFISLVPNKKEREEKELWDLMKTNSSRLNMSRFNSILKQNKYKKGES